jgi:hypothetical protein
MSEAAARLLADGRRYDSILATTSHCGREAHEWAANKPVCTENLIRVDEVMESPKLAE